MTFPARGEDHSVVKGIGVAVFPLLEPPNELSVVALFGERAVSRK